ncbi:hypothetical protein SUGI_0243920 [Cryptomeria japonica]|nr:hypothetical protein SUGI_0243920 [Cryptomeria japonica]
MATNYFRKDSPKLDGTNYGIWKIKMETHLNCIGKDIWDIIKNGYIAATLGQPAPPNLTKDKENDCKAREALLSALSDQQIMGLSDRSTTKAIWDHLETLNEGDCTIKIVKLESFRVRYEHLKMEEDERISAFMERVNEIVLGIKCCGGTLSEDEIVSKVLRGFPPAYKMKVTAINELRTMPNTSIDLAFKASISSTPSFDKLDWKAFYARELEETRKENEELEELEAPFARKMPKGPVGSKYEGKAPFKYFNCNKIGHMASRCPDRYARLREEARRTYKPNPEYQRYKFKKSKDKSCYIANESVTDDFEEDLADNGWVFVAITEDQPTPTVQPIEQALAAKIEVKDQWIIDLGCSHHMTGDKGKL